MLDRLDLFLDSLKARTTSMLRDAARVSIAILTSDKFLQGALTGTLLGIITSVAQGVGQTTHFVIYTETNLYVSAHFINALFEVLLLLVIVWAIRHQDEWTNLFEEATGEDVEEVQEEIDVDGESDADSEGD